ncbi:MAG: DEAD/DEAH box helicase [Coriobacteriales bacterium]|nr:DEAD/DEAH box helicase [Coriobacteriales bacterium]
MFEVVGLDETADARSISRGHAYYRAGMVGSLHVASGVLTAEVRGSNDNDYAVTIGLNDNGDINVRTGTCTCQAYWEYGGGCKHIVAVADAAYETLNRIADSAFSADKTGSGAAEQRGKARENSLFAATLSRASDREATDLLKKRAQLAANESRHSTQALGTVVLEPTLREGDDYYDEGSWRLTFRAGVSKLYVVMNLREFKQEVLSGGSFQLGKKGSVWIGRDAFDDSSRQVLDFLLKHLTIPQSHYFYYGGQRKDMELDQAAVDELFTALDGRFIRYEYNEYPEGELSFRYRYKPKKRTRNLYVQWDDFPLSLTLTRSEEGAVLKARGTYQVVEGLAHIHVIADDTVYSCSGAYSKACRDLLMTLQQSKRGFELYFEQKDIPALFATILAEADGFLDFDIEDGLNGFMPPALVTKVYFDVTDAGDITAKMTFTYANKTHYAFRSKKISESYDLTGEYRAENTLGYFMGDLQTMSAGTLLLPAREEQRIYELATQGIEEITRFAEVYVSDEFKRVSVRPATVVTVGVKVASNLLSIDFDIEGLDYSELAQVLSAYRKAKHYVRLRDGSFLTFQDDSLAQFSELAEGLEFSEKDLAAGHVELDVNRALYVDTLLKGNDELRYKRDDELRGIVRAMKDVADADYALPSVLDPVMRNYQKTGYRWLRTLAALRFGGILADDMGLGKTIQVLAVLQAKKDEAVREGVAPKPSIVVCPASLVLNWQSEAARFTPELKVAALTGAAAERAGLIRDIGRYDLLVTSYDQLKRDIGTYQPSEFAFVILDEAQMIKNQTTQNAKSVKQLKGDTRLALTGTPVENSLAELWSIFDFLMPGYLRAYTHFKKRYETPIVRDKSLSATERLRALVRPFILRRLKQDVLKELPDKIESTLAVSLTEAQRKLYLATLAQSKKDLARKLAQNDGPQNRIAVLAALTRLRQLCCDPALVYEEYDGGSGKLDACLELIESSHASGHRMLLFSQFTSMLDLLETQLNQRDIAFYRLDGATPKQLRQNLVNDFNAGAVPVFLISLKAGGTGLNLTGADVVIHFDPWWNLSAQNQATDRTHRIGQTKSVQVFKLIAKDTIEEKILKIQEQKYQLAQQIIQEGGNAFDSLSSEELLGLLEEG